jgi:pyridoxal phosphate enzyme (YggS family)
MDSIAERLHDTLAVIREAYSRSKRLSSEGDSHEQGSSHDPLSAVTYVAVTKTRTSEEMNSYARAARAEGIPVIFGESYVQEFREKAAGLVDYDEIHLIGPLQSNKIREAVANFDLIQSVHSEKALRLIAREAARLGKRQRILLQVNIGKDPRKSGFMAHDIGHILEIVKEHSAVLQLEGLMTITPFYDLPEEARQDYRAMQALRNEVQQSGWISLFFHERILLSMGMSGDFAVAIEEGADFVRIGTALFGER